MIIGFDEGEKINYPKTLLKGDIRDYTEEKPCRIIGIFSKSILEKQYKEITYLASNVTINRFFTNEQLNKLISKDEIFSYNRKFIQCFEIQIENYVNKNRLKQKLHLTLCKL